nr:ATP synthase F1 subunit 8 [Crocus sativus]
MKKLKIMPQLDKFTYFTQFFWLCLLFFTFYIALWNYGDGVIGISRILKLRKQLLSHQAPEGRRNDASLEDISRKGFRTSLSYMYSTLLEVSQWCQTVASLVKGRIIALIFCFGEISGVRGMESQIPYLISKFSFLTSSSRITRRIERILHYISNGQRSIQ